MFLPKLIQRAMKADTDAATEEFGRNEQVKNVFLALYVSAGIPFMLTGYLFMRYRDNRY